MRSKPEGGKANEELIKLLSKTIGISSDCFKILRGATSRNKMIKIDTQNLDLQGILIRLGLGVMQEVVRPLLKPGAPPIGDGSTSSPRARLLDGARPAVPAIAPQERRLEPVEGCEFQKRSIQKKIK